MKRPAFQFYPGDWLRDAHLRICSPAARSLWIDLLCLMHQAEPYGHLMFNDKPLQVPQIARMLGIPPRDCARWIKELEDAGVPSRDDRGALYSRRMVRDELLRNARASGGPKGAAFGSQGAEFGSKGGRPRRDNNPPSTGVSSGVSEPGLKPPPSSSSSTSIEASSQDSTIPPAGTRGLEDESRSKPKPESRAITKTRQQIETQREAAARAAPMPEALKAFTRARETPLDTAQGSSESHEP